MNIGIFTETFLPNIDGVVVSILNMNKLLVDRGHKISVFTAGGGPEEVDGCRVFRTKGLGLPSYKGYKLGIPSLKIMNQLVKGGADIIHSRGPFTIGLMAKHMSKIMKLPIIGTFDTPIQDYLHYLPVAGKFKTSKDALTKIAIKYSMWYYNRCDLVTAPSVTIKKDLEKMGCKKRIEVLSNGVDINRFSPENYSEELRSKLCSNDERMIFHVGRITKEKGVDVLLKAARALKLEGLRFKLVIGGKGPVLDDLKAMSRNLGISDSVVFAGFISDEDLPKYYATADVFATASIVETQGIVMLEAMASGTPVVGAQAGAIPELVRDDINGFVFKPTDHKQAAEKLINVIGNESLRKELSSGAIKSVRDHSLEKVCDKVESIYNELTNS